MRSIYKIFFKIFLLAGFIIQARAQNTVLPITSIPGQVSPIALAPSLNTTVLPSYTRTYVPLLPVTDPDELTLNAGAYMARIATSNMDGFGRAFQKVVHNTGKVGSQLYHAIQPIDTRLQKENYNYLPYASTSSAYQYNLFYQQQVYYNQRFPDEDYTSYSTTKVISTPARRSMVGLAAGKSQIGQGRGDTITAILNTAGEVRYWDLDANGLPYSGGYYPAGTLKGVLKTGPHGRDEVSYFDKAGNNIYTRKHLTNELSGTNVLAIYGVSYNIYDEMGQLRFFLPPAATDAAPSAPTQSLLDRLAFQYRYDSYGRVVEKHVPGKDWEYYVYDKKGRQIMYQDGNLRNGSPKRWMFTYYDVNGRVAFTALCDATETRAAMEMLINDASTWSAPHWLHYFKSYAITNQYPTNITNCAILSYNYYDDYSIIDPAGTHYDDLTNTLNFYEHVTTPGAEIPQRSNRTQGLPTGSRVRIFAGDGADENQTGDWRSNIIYYDEKGRAIYALSRTESQGSPIRTEYSGTQYDFLNRPLISKHMLSNELSEDGVITHTELTRSYYDQETGKLTKTTHKIGDSGAWNTTSMYEYDELGQNKRKVLGNYGEVQDYTYNIRGQLKGINAYYAETGNRQGESRTFGESIYYDYGYEQPRYDGLIAGTIWRGAGTGAQKMSYGYRYDNSGRLVEADYYRFNGTGWAKNVSDYTVSGIVYDLNGNIKAKKQRGPDDNNQPAIIDDLNYSYKSQSNLLQSVTDAIPMPNIDRGDFHDNGSTGALDYDYDLNGNLTLDANKGITSISYNILNRPERIEFSNGDLQVFSYDATGAKLQEYKLINGTEETTDYIGNFVYKDRQLQYVNTAEGRSVYDIDNQSFKEEFFVKDHLGNIRSVVDVYNYPILEYLGTYEIASAALEGLFFDHHNEIGDPIAGSVDPDNQMSGRLNGAESDRRIGTSMLTKVMAGDKVSMTINTQYYGYEDGTEDSPVGPEDMLNQVIATLTEGAGGLGSGEMHNPDLVYSMFHPENMSQFDDLVSNFNTDPYKPKAYLNYILFDENMQIVKEMSGAFQASNSGGAWTEIGTNVPMEIPVNGYLAVYLSNRSVVPNCLSCGDVFFDQLVLRFSRGSLKEEKHYYPHGLPMAGIGSAAAGFAENKRTYQSNEYNRSSGLNWMDFHNRQYDPQLGRFLSVDPLSEATANLSPYAAMDNNPVSGVDPLGLSNNHFESYHTNPERPTSLLPNMHNYWLGGHFNPAVDMSYQMAYSELARFIPEDYLDAMLANGVQINVVACAGKVGGNGGEGKNDGGTDKGTFGTKEKPTELPGVTVSDTRLEHEGSSTLKGALAIAATTSAVDGPLPIGEIVGGVILAGALVYDATQITFITYTLTGPGGETYVGRSSGFGPPEVIMRNRFASHHKRLEGYTNPQLDRAVQGIHGYSAIRGREQQMIDYFGGVGASGVGNSIRGVSRYNPAGIFYHGAANNFFGNIAPYTGWRP